MQASEPGHPAARRPPLVRPRRGRLIAGVCRGLADYFAVDPILVRIVFVATSLFVGIGIWVYLAVFLLVPEEGARRAPIRLRASSWRIVLGVVALIVAAAIVIPIVSRDAFGSGWGLGAGVAAVVVVGFVALAVWLRLRASEAVRQRRSADLVLLRNLSLGVAIAAGVLLVAIVGAWLGGIAPHVAAWAVVVGGALLLISAFTRARLLVLGVLAFAVPVAVVAAAHVDLHGGLGERVYRPHSLGELRDGYRLGAGRLEVDLRDISFPPVTPR